MRAARVWLTSLALAGVLAAGGCGDKAGGGKAGGGAAQQHTAPSPAAPGAGAVADESAKAQAGDRAPAALPRKVTAGDVLPPLPPLPRRLASGGADAAPELPNISCARMAPDGTFKLAKRVEVTRLGQDVVTFPEDGAADAGERGKHGKRGKRAKRPVKQGAASGGKAAAKPHVGTLELCLFHQWRAREPGENRTHTGRVHHFAAAFPGDEASSWTSEELTRVPKTLPEDARYLAAGWAMLLPTGLPDRPALAVVSGRFYDGTLGEEVHYIRKARLLQRKGGRWKWVPWMTRTYHSLDVAHLRQVCKKSEAPACRRAAARIAAAEQGAERRLKIRARRLAGRARLKPGRFSRDPQSAWIALARQALRKGRWREAVALALQSEVVCGEASRVSRAVLGRALQLGKVKAELAEPAVTRRPLCEPLVDKPAPKTRKLVPAP